jgi:hypothetical protein
MLFFQWGWSAKLRADIIALEGENLRLTRSLEIAVQRGVTVEAHLILCRQSQQKSQP